MFGKLIVVPLFPLLLLLSTALASIAQEDPPAQWDQLIDRSHAERTVLLNAYYEGGISKYDSTTVFRHIAKLKALSEQHDDQALWYEAQLIRAHYFYNSESIPVAKTLEVLKNTLRRAKVDDVLWLQIRIESLLGHYNYNKLKQYERALIHLTRAANLMNNKDAANYPLKQVCNFHVGVALYTFDDLQHALGYLKRALQADVAEGMTDYSVNVVNTIGLIYRDQDNLDSSDRYFRKALEIGRQRNHQRWIAIAKGNLGENFYLRNDFGKALPMLRTDARIAEKRHDWGVASNALTLMGEIHLQNGQIDSAKTYLRKARDYAQKSGQPKRFERVYPRLAKLYAATGKPRLAATYVDSTIRAGERVERKKNKMLMARSEQKVAHEKYLDNLEKLKLEKEKKVQERNTLIASIIALVAIVSLLYNLLWHKYQRKRRELKQSNRELKNAKEGLYEITEKLAERNREFESLKKQAQEASNGAMQELQQTTILTEEDWEHFQQLFEKAYGGYLNRLQEKHPDLTQGEIRFIALKKMKLHNKKMAEVLGIGNNAIRQYRLRIRRKLSLTKEDKLEELVDSI